MTAVTVGPNGNGRWGQRLGPQAPGLVRISQLVDALLIAVSLALVWHPDLRGALLEFILVLMIVPSWMSLLRFFGLYESHRVEGVAALVRRFISAQTTGFALFLPLVLLVGGPERLLQLAQFVGLSTVILLCQKYPLYNLLHTFRRRGFDQRQVCVIGTWETAGMIAGEFSRHPEWGLHVSCVGVGPPSRRQFLRFPSRELLTEELPEVPRRQVIDEFVIAVPPAQLEGEKDVLTLCNHHGLNGRVLPFPLDLDVGTADVEDFCGQPSFSVGGLGHDRVAVAIKRLMDVVMASLLLVLCLPVMLLAAILVKLSSQGPVFFTHTRAGLRGREFRMYKFRTMIDGAENLAQSLAHRSVTKGPIFKDPVDWRVTPIGRILRRSSIDELPQLVNVLKGDMSMVGPRPLPPSEARAISGLYRKRFSMRPGITCLWQVRGRSDVEYAEWMGYDLQYIEKWSLWLDAKLLLQTVPAVLSGKGAY